MATEVLEPPKYSNLRGVMPLGVKGKKVLPPFPEEWAPTHTINGVEVMRVEGTKVNNASCPPVWFKEDGSTASTGAGREAIPLSHRDITGRIMPESELDYRRGYEDALAGKDCDPDAPRYERRKFRARDLSTAFMAVMGAHDGSPLVLSADASESEYAGRTEDGGYVVICRIYDWNKKSHAIHRLRIPKDMWLEVDSLVMTE